MRSRHCLAFAVLLLAAAAPRDVAAGAPPTPGPSSIGNELVRGIAVSPLYEQTGLVVATAVETQCGQGSQCMHLWISHDGGSSWQRAAAAGWDGGMPAVLVTSSGAERLIANAPKSLQQSDDDGDTWHDFGPPGVPTALPSYKVDGGIAVAGGAGGDELLRGGVMHTVSGSGGAYDDMEFGIPTAFPASGRQPAALLSAIDKKTSALFVEQCDATLRCQAPEPIAGATATMGAPAHLEFSSGYASDGTVFAQVLTSGLYKSTNGGTSFVPLHMGKPGATITEVTGLALAHDYQENGTDRVVVASVMQLTGSGAQTRISGDVFRSADGGTTWRAVGSPGLFDGGATAVAMAPDGRIFGGYMHTPATTGLLCSTDGATWRASCPPVGDWAATHRAHAGATPMAGCIGAGCPQHGTAAGSAHGSAGSSQAGEGGNNGGGGSDASLSGAGVGSPGVPGGRVGVGAVALAAAALLAVLAVLRRRKPVAE